MQNVKEKSVPAQAQRRLQSDPLNPCELEIDLFCRGMRITPLARNRVRLARRTRAGLGSGLEMVLPGPTKDIWVNVPVSESFTSQSPYLLTIKKGDFFLTDERSGHQYPVRIDPAPSWYDRETSRGVPMSRVGVLQGTYLGIYIGPVCRYWTGPLRVNCGFCTTGVNVGSSEMTRKSVADVVETCQAAEAESGVTFVHFNTGYQEGRGTRLAAPFLRAVKASTHLLVGLQLAPSLDLTEYDRLIDLGADHFSFCFEFMNREVFRKLCPGKYDTLGQAAFFRAMEYTASKMGKGRVSGEIIAGVEPLADTMRAIDRITDCGAFPTICVFRPLEGSDMEDHPVPPYEKMRVIFQYMIESCIRKRIPIGIAPNIEVSLVVQPTDALYLAPLSTATQLYQFQNLALSLLFRGLYFCKKTFAGWSSRVFSGDPPPARA